MDPGSLDVRVAHGSRLAGVYVRELRLPAGAAPTLVVREGNSLVPEPDTRLTVCDDVVVVATPGARAATEDRIRALDRSGRLAAWYDPVPSPGDDPAARRRSWWGRWRERRRPPAQRRGTRTPRVDP